MTTMSWRVGGVVVVAAVVVAVGAFAYTQQSESEVTFCTMEGMIGPNNTVFGRSNSHGCQFLGADGELLRFTMQGDPLCYDEFVQIVPCEQPGARPPE